VTARALFPTREESIPALASAALFAISFPPLPLLVPVFLCLTPFAVAVARRADGEGPSGGAGSAARIGLWFGMAGFALTLYWIASALALFTPLAFAGFLGSLVWLSPFFAIAGAALYAARRRTGWPLAVLLPAVWAAVELMLNYAGDLAFPWLPLGLALAKYPTLIQIADLSGVRGVGVWIAATNGLVADAWLMRGRQRAVAWRVTAVAGLAAAVWTYGRWRQATIRLEPLAPVAVVQPNIPEDDKLRRESGDRFIAPLAALTREVVRRDPPRLVVWPETALPGYLTTYPEWLDSLRAVASAGRTPILFGVLDARPTSDTSYDYFNAAMLTDTLGMPGAAPAYHKSYLVPVVERVPFIDPSWFRNLEYFGGFGRGEPPAPMRTPAGAVGVLICYESAFPQLSRRYRRLGADLLVNITNDAWFGRSAAPWQHEAHLALRAVENRVGVVRAANTGISEYVDPLGRVHGATDLFVPAAATFQTSTTHVLTPFVRFGDTLGPLSLLLTVVLVILPGARRRAGSDGAAA
jgi:apolipoprotein N-acyltransferase